MEHIGSLLIIDDDVSSLTELTHILRSYYKIYTAKNGEDGLMRAQQALPDLILLDVVMPDMSGFDVLEKLKQSELTRHIPVIFITGLSKRVSEETALAKGAVDFISKPFSPAIVMLRIAIQMKILDQMHTIEKMSMLDYLTGLPNRRNFEKSFESEWNRASRDKSTLSIMILDIDDFKYYNDTYGHSQGDKALKGVSSVFKKCLKRPGDFVARWGGEEFIVLLPETDSKGAVTVAEEIRRSVQSLEILSEEGMITGLTVSTGIYTRTPDSKISPKDFIPNADKALFEAKASGKNTYRTFT